MPKCTECGKEFEFQIVQSGNYIYKSSLKRETIEGVTETIMGYQCSYTCWNHAKLRTKAEQRSMLQKNYEHDVKLSEETMTAQGKTILHPIKLKIK